MAEENRSRRGNAAVVALSLSALLGFGALAVDVAWMRVNQLQLSIALEAGAVGGVAYLDGTVAGVETAIAQAVALALANPVYSAAAIGPGHVQVGDWDEDARTFTPYASWGEEEVPTIDAVRMDVTLNDVDAILAGAAFGQGVLSVRADATAWKPLEVSASVVPCYLPLAMPTCLFPVDAETNPPPVEINFGDALTDTVGWALPGGVNANDVRAQLVDGCGSGSLGVGDDVAVQNGIISNAVTTVGDILNGQKGTNEPWPADVGPMPDRTDPAVAFPSAQSLVKGQNWGNTLQGAVALVDLGGEPGTCAGASNFNGTQPVLGFTWGILYDARKENAKSSGFMIQLDYVGDHELGTEGSVGAVGNVTAPEGKPVLVW